ncbi:MAG TPA: SURF1 family protein [Casimicrobiaceae bacterium]|nr:SURF1 family protein [Casimicrobiaceae bacterium]
MTIDARAAAAGPELDPRRRPAWLPTLAAFLAIALCVTAGNWQHRRMLEKEALLAKISAAKAAPVVPLPTEVRDWTSWRFRAVTLDGEFDARHQILIDNAQHAGRVGFDVVAPLLLRDGRSVLVDRGFIPAGVSRASLPSPPIPEGRVTIDGRIDIPSRRYIELGAHVTPKGSLWQHIDTTEFAQATGVSVLPIIVRDIGQHANGLVLDDALPDTGIEKHVSYMLQWYTFAALAAGLWLWFSVRPWWQRRVR